MGLAGIYVTGRNHQILYNDISHVLMNLSNWDPAESKNDADGIRFFGFGHVFKGNYIHDILIREGNSKAHIDCFQTWGPAQNITLDGNKCENQNYGMQGLMVEQIYPPVSKFKIMNNIFTTQGASVLFTNKDSQPYLRDIKIINNTFYKSGWHSIFIRGVKEAKIYNNLFIDCGGHKWSSIGKGGINEFKAGFNAHYMTNGRYPAGKPKASDLWQVNPLCINIEKQNFRLQHNSPLIDAGVNLSEIENDFDGVVRPQLKKLDIGAFEFSTKSSP